MSFEIYKNICSSLSKNYRPSLHGRILKNLDLFDFFDSIFDKFEMYRYSDDLYVMFNNVNHSKKNIYEQIKKILTKHNFDLNKKYILEQTKNLPNNISLKIYDFYLYDEDFNIEDFLGDSNDIVNKIKNYLKKLKYIQTLENYNELVEECFSIKVDSNLNFKKNVFNEILFNKRIYHNLKNKEITSLIDNNIIKNKLKFDPIKLTLLILFTKDENLIKKFLYNLYKKYENKTANEFDIISSFTYISQRNICEATKNKLICKIKNYDINVSKYLKIYL